MTHLTMSMGERTKGSPNNQIATYVDRYDAAILGAPFKVILLHSVQQWFDCDTGKLTRTVIPNVNGLKKAVAAVRCMHPRKLSGEELKFVRKAMGFKGVELSHHLDITPEHLSRCENNDRVLSGSAEKILRAFVVNRSHILFDIMDRLIEEIDADQKILDSAPNKFNELISKYREVTDSLNFSILGMTINTAFDPFDPLEFSFSLVDIGDTKPEDDEARWQEAVAA